MRAPVLGIFAAALASGCSVEGSVSITFLMPEADNLSPVGPDVTLGEVALTILVPGDEPQRQSRAILDGSEGLDIGQIPIADDVALEVELRSPSQRLIGFGRTAGTFDVAEEGVTEVEIVVRRPLAYVTGGTAVDTFDGALESSFAYKGSIALSPNPTAVASTRAGDALVTAGGNDLRLVSTSNHAPMQFSPVPLGQPAAAIAISPDDEYVAVAHSGAGGGVSIVRLADIQGETAAAFFAAHGDVAAVAFGASADPDTAPLLYLLLDAAGADIDCGTVSGSSSIVVVAANRPADVVVTANPGARIADIAVDPLTGTVALADPCANQVAAMQPLLDPSARTELQSIRRPTAVAALDGYVWSVGAQPATGATGAFHIVGSVSFDGSGASLLELPVAQESALSLDFSDQGQFAEMRMDADLLVALDLAVLPGAEHVSVLSRGYYHGNEEGDILFGPIIPEMWLNAWEYLLIDTASGVPVQRVRTRCDLDWAHNAFLDAFRCTQAPGQDVVTGTPYEPKQVSILYGER